MSDHTEKKYDVRMDAVSEPVIAFCKYQAVPDWNHSNAVFSYWTLYWNSGEGASIEFNGNARELTPDAVALIPAFTTFNARSRRPFMHFYAPFKLEAPFDRVKREPMFFDSSILRSKFAQFELANEIERAILVRIIINEYLLMIPRALFLPPGKSPMDGRVKKALSMINSEPFTHKTNRELARRAGLSLNVFYQLFKRETGSTPKSYILAQRMSEARGMLLADDCSIDEIASATGYADRYHFSKAFKSVYGKPPAAFRNAAHGKKRETES